MENAEKPVIIFLNAPSSRAVYKEDRCQIDANDVLARFFRPPISLMLLAAIAEAAGYTSRIMDCPAQRYVFTNLKDTIKRLRPAFVVVNTSEQTEREDSLSLRIAKLYGSRTIAFGYHVTVQRTNFLNRFPWVDIIIKKEAEETLKEILAGGELRNIKGICYRDQRGGVNENPERAFMTDLDAIPFGCHHLIDFGKYLYPLSGKPFTVIQVSRGCPFACKFCLAKYMNGLQFRTRSPQKVLDEIEHVVKDLKVSTFFLRADTFTLNKEWIHTFCKGILQRGLCIEWFTNSRIDTIPDTYISLMGASGCRIIGIGIESGIPRHQQLIGKNIKLDGIDEKLKLLKRNGILSIIYFLIGQPFDTIRTINYNIAYSRTLHSTFVEFTPYIGFHEVELRGAGFGHPIPPAQVRRLGKRGELLFYMRWRKIREVIEIVSTRAVQNLERVPYLLLNAARYFVRMLAK
jgi:anaerobic magnesium-protoporphyrin IX monomethyl ester cyclase